MAHTYTHLLIHALFSTKDREPHLDAELRPQLFAYLGGIITKLGGKPVLIGGVSDHTHILFLLPPTLSVSDLMEKVKANSSKWVHDRWARRERFAWQTGYTAFSVSESSAAKAKEYIADQEGHHRRMTYQEEVLKFLNMHAVEYDRRHALD